MLTWPPKSRMKLIGQDKQPLDMTREDHVDIFKRSTEQWKEKVLANKDNSLYGFADIEGFKAEPYGTTYREV